MPLLNLGSESPITGLDPEDPLGLFAPSRQQPTGLDPSQLGNQQQLITQFQDIISQFQGMFNQQPGIGAAAGGASTQLGLGAAQGAGQGLEQFTGQGFLAPQIQGSFNAIQHLLGQQLGGPGGVDQSANLAGGFGGGRNLVESGAAIGTAGAAFGQQVGDIFRNDLQRRQEAAGQQGQQQLFGTSLGLQGLQQGFDLQQQGLLGAFGGVNQLSGLLGPPQQIGGGGTGAGQAGGAGGILGGIFSDERLKENIVMLGLLASGQPFYAFNYIGHPDARFIGVMAQESPWDAVSVHESGYLMVDYGRIH